MDFGKIQSSIPSNIKSNKKLAKAMRKIARQQSGEFAENLKERLQSINVALKPRPNWIPQGVWRWFGNKFIDLSAIENFINQRNYPQ